MGIKAIYYWVKGEKEFKKLGYKNNQVFNNLTIEGIINIFERLYEEIGEW
jgi:hypothetical protein